MLNYLQPLVTLGAEEIRPSSGFCGHMLKCGTHVLACTHAHICTDTHMCIEMSLCVFVYAHACQDLMSVLSVVPQALFTLFLRQGLT